MITSLSLVTHVPSHPEGSVCLPLLHRVRLTAQADGAAVTSGQDGILTATTRGVGEGWVCSCADQQAASELDICDLSTVCHHTATHPPLRSGHPSCPLSPHIRGSGRQPTPEELKRHPFRQSPVSLSAHLRTVPLNALRPQAIL